MPLVDNQLYICLIPCVIHTHKAIVYLFQATLPQVSFLSHYRLYNRDLYFVEKYLLYHFSIFRSSVIMMKFRKLRQTLGLSKPYPCTSCDSRFSSRSELNIHRISHLDIQVIVNPVPTKGKYHSLVEKKPDPAKLSQHFKCKTCPLTFSKYKSLLKHTFAHDQAMVYSIQELKRKMLDQRMVHQLQHIRSTQCAPSQHVSAISKNQALVAKESRERMTCTFCNNTYKGMRGLRLHHKSCLEKIHSIAAAETQSDSQSKPKLITLV